METTNSNYFGTEKISRILLKIAPPVMLAQLIQALYNIVDSLFVGKYSESGLTALSIIYPLQLLMIAIAVGTGVGINTAMAHYLGVHDEKKANEYGGIGTPLTLVLWVLFALICFLFMPAYARMSTDSAEVIKDVIVYGRIVCVFSIGLFTESIWTKILQANGDMKTPMIAQIVGALVNIALDPLFIFVLGFGVQGAAIATVISQTLSAVFVLYFLTRKSELKVRFVRKDEISECAGYAKNIVSLGTAGFIMQLTNSLVTICCNNVLSVTGGDIYISVMTIVSSVRQLVETPIYAMNEGTSPILSYNYGARRPARVRKAMCVMSAMILGYTAVMWSVIVLAPHALIGIFSSDAVLTADAVPALKQYFAAFIFMDLQYIGQTVFKSLNKKKQAIFFSLLRKVFIVVPLTYLMPYALHMGTRGVFLAEPVSNIIGGSLCFITMLCTVLPELKRMEK